MDKNKILTADFLDILFEGKNKEYGAYDLRKTYNRRITIALAVMLAVCLAVGVAFAVSKFKGTQKQAQVVIQDVDLQNVKEQPKPEPPPPPPPPKVEPPKIEIKQFTAPKLVKEEVKEPPPEQEKLEDTKIGTINQEGVKSDVVAPPVEEHGTGVVEAPKVTEDYDKEFKTVQIQAKFPGGPDAWIAYLKRNLRSEVPTDNGAAPGKYTVIVSFLVDKTGAISEVKADNDPGYGTAAEAVRVIQRGPAWTPAVQNGRNVIYRQKQSITFEVQESQ